MQDSEGQREAPQNRCREVYFEVSPPLPIEIWISKFYSELCLGLSLTTRLMYFKEMNHRELTCIWSVFLDYPGLTQTGVETCRSALALIKRGYLAKRSICSRQSVRPLRLSEALQSRSRSQARNPRSICPVCNKSFCCLARTIPTVVELPLYLHV